MQRYLFKPDCMLFVVFGDTSLWGTCFYLLTCVDVFQHFQFEFIKANVTTFVDQSLVAISARTVELIHEIATIPTMRPVGFVFVLQVIGTLTSFIALLQHTSQVPQTSHQEVAKVRRKKGKERDSASVKV